MNSCGFCFEAYVIKCPARSGDTNGRGGGYQHYLRIVWNKIVNFNECCALIRDRTGLVVRGTEIVGCDAGVCGVYGVRQWIWKFFVLANTHNF